MAKTESTAVTRLIELAQQRPVEGNFDWFGAPMGKPKKRLERERTAHKREEVTQVVRVPGRSLQASPATVVGAFFAGVLTVALTMVVMRSSEPARDPAAVPAAAGDSVREIAPVVAPTPPPPTTVVAALPAPVAVSEIEKEKERVSERVSEIEMVREPETVAVAVAETPVVRAPTRAGERPTRPARARAPAELTRPRTGRPNAREGGSPLAELRISSKPPCQLIIDGRDMGWTPQRGIAVAPGRHTVVFRNREFGVERKVIVDAKVGEVHRVIRDFTEP